MESAWKKILKTFFLWKTLAAVSLVLGLGLEHSCPWPRECLSSERLSLALALASDFFCVLGLGLEPCVLDSTSVKMIPLHFSVSMTYVCFCLALWLIVHNACFFFVNVRQKLIRWCAGGGSWLWQPLWSFRYLLVKYLQVKIVWVMLFVIVVLDEMYLNLNVGYSVVENLRSLVFVLYYIGVPDLR